ncbi:S-adenosyl-L-methionine-dependent methyltransferase [Xylariomycetidae sp. FL2044]|nr:S-adenosyl-L-methionine-dependent methyltransferase [Xylariomycetidae sp. FL2044]
MPALTKAQRKLADGSEESFNRVYAVQYGNERWQQSLLPALLAPTRYAMLVNTFAAGDSSNLLHEGDVSSVSAVAFPQKMDQADEPDDASFVAFQRIASTTEAEPPFPVPQAGATTRLMTHWNLDAASLLAVRVLEPRPGDKILDMCAAPGGKSVAISQLLRVCDESTGLQSLGGGCLHSNEVNNGRNHRLASNLQAYLPADLFKADEVKVLKTDGSEPNAAQSFPHGAGGYDKVLLDAPCSSERHIIHAHSKAKQGGRAAEEMISWRSGHSKKLAKTQAALLLTALKAVKTGGTVLYATCSLSNDENDGVVEKGMELVQKERRKLGAPWDVSVRSGDWAGRGLEQWAEPTKRGWIVLPDHAQRGRWGPLYFAVLQKIAA